MILLFGIMEMLFGNWRLKMNKRGSLFLSLYLVILAVSMIGAVTLAYAYHQEDIAGSVISPLSVLDIRDSLEGFEIAERALIEDSLGKSDFDAERFEEEFISGISPEMEDFVLDGLYWEGVLVNVEGSFDKDDFFRNTLYDVREGDGGIVLTRNSVQKRGILKSAEETIVNFDVDYVFEFSAEYLISREGSKYKVERIV
jgi:hypothetical protein